MNEFLRNFVMRCITDMVERGKELYVVYQYALGWYEKGVLTQADLEEIQAMYEEETPVEETNNEEPVVEGENAEEGEI